MEVKDMKDVRFKAGVIRPVGADDVREIRFKGRELASGRTYCGQTSSGDDCGTDFTIYQTAAGKIVILWYRWSKWQGENRVRDYVVLDDLPSYEPIVGETTKMAVKVPGSLLQEAAAALGQDMAVYID